MKTNAVQGLLLTGLLSTLMVLSFLSGYSQTSDPNLGIIPAPLAIRKSPGEFVLSQLTHIQADEPDHKAVVFLKEHLFHSWNFSNKLSTHAAPKGTNLIKLTSKGADNLPSEGYKLEITPTQVTITGKEAGLFYGIQSFLQLFPIEKSGTVKLPCVSIEDQPRFGYRGLMLDVSRHFFTVAEVKQLIDLMSYYKLNRFHWHLTDDQGWRIEIKSLPKLTEVGAWRVPRVDTWGKNEAPKPGELATDGGFYTQDQIRDVVRYAAERYIEILPEIDVPGHSMAAIAAYPELCVTKDPNIKVNPGSSFSKWYGNGKFEMFIDNTLNPADEKVYDFLDKVFTEVAQLFPYEYIHMGGDECFKGYWQKAPQVQAFMEQNGLKNTGELQSYFVKRVAKIVESKNKKLIGWDEIIEGGLADGAAVMSWQGEKGGIHAAQLKHNTIMTPGSAGLYFDYYQSLSPQEPINIHGHAPLQKTYGYDPVPKVLTPDQQQYIMGVQANVWTEHILTQAKLQYMILPRIFALSEIAWTPVTRKDYRSFAEHRVSRHLAQYDKMGYNYRVPPAMIALDTTMIGEKFTFNLKPTIPGAKIHYTFNGRIPSNSDPEYNGQLVISIPANQKRDLKTVVISPSGKRSIATNTVLYNPQLLPAVSQNPTLKGIKYKLLKGQFTSTDQVLNNSLIDSGVVQTFVMEDFKKKTESLGLIYDGFIRINKDGVYGFSMSSSEGSQLLIDNEIVISNEQGTSRAEKSGTVSLANGFHKIMIKCFDKEGPASLKVYITEPGANKKELSAGMLFN